MQAAVAPAVALGGYLCRFRWWSEDPYWENQVGNQEEHEAHPHGYMRMFNAFYDAWFWVHADGIADAKNGQMVAWDTVALWL
jgi:hypothetical protein